MTRSILRYTVTMAKNKHLLTYKRSQVQPPARVSHSTYEFPGLTTARRGRAVLGASNFSTHVHSHWPLHADGTKSLCNHNTKARSANNYIEEIPSSKYITNTSKSIGCPFYSSEHAARSLRVSASECPLSLTADDPLVRLNLLLLFVIGRLAVCRTVEDRRRDWRAKRKTRHHLELLVLTVPFRI
ncbi:hypothetical protein BC835DRAFT_190870 [Cytidiella melzeri]|nr:hypothetical protein BC835DRAFT_190870 [Cytidiella melzeri]